MKYASNKDKYFEHNRNGIKLIGNKYYDKFPEYFVFQQRRERINEIFAELKEASMGHVLGNNIYTATGYFLTPLPNKSRRLISTNQELKDFQIAEREAVVMRIYEYTRGLRSKVGINEYYQLINDEKNQTMVYLSNIANRIGDWWKGILKKEPINNYAKK